MENNYFKFFIITPVGFEKNSIIEFRQKVAFYFNLLQFEILETKGGFEVNLPLNIGLALNQILRTPTRILLRVEEFKCRDLPKLFQKTSKIKWSLYLLGTNVEFETSAKNSRLFDDRKINKTILDAITLFFDSNPRKKKYIELAESSKNIAKIFVRFNDDLCTISIDTSGEMLYKRSEKMLTGLAPLRENLATLLLLELIKELPSEQMTLIDPMCGSGTFLIESHDYHQLNNKRIFSYFYLPLYIEDKNKLNFENLNLSPLPFNYLGFDINSDVLKLTQENIGERKVTIENKNVFKENIANANKNLIIINPPYGIRVKTEEEINQKYFENLLKAIKNNYNPERIGIIIPSQFNTININGLNLISRTKFKNGGIPVTFYVYAK